MRFGAVRDLLSGDLARIQRVLAVQPGRTNPAQRALALIRKWSTPSRGDPLVVRIPLCPPLPILWRAHQAKRDRSPAAFLHWAILREAWRERSLTQRGGLLLRLALLWLPANLVVSAWSTSLNATEIKRRTGKGVLRQLAEQLAVLVAYDVRAPWYYTFDLFEDSLRSQAGDYLSRAETKSGAFLLFRRYLRGTEKASLGHKWRFFERCEAHQLRTMPVLAYAESGVLHFVAGEELPRRDLFVKPTKGRGGVGSDWWACEGDGYRSSAGIQMTREALTQHIVELSRIEPYLVAPRLKCHPDLEDLSNGALSTARIVTLRNERGGFEATDAVFRMAVGSNTIIDNFHAGGLASNVAMATGELSRATDLALRPDVGWRDVHPSGAMIAGRKLPFWREAIELVERAHVAFPDRVLIGWDVAMLADGPCIIEGNGGPDLDIHQRCSRTPSGRTRLGQLLAFHTQRALDARAERARASA